MQTINQMDPRIMSPKKKIMRKNLNYIITGFVFFALAFASCKKTESEFIKVAESAVHFVGTTNPTYTLSSSTTGPFTVNIGTTDVTTADRSVTIDITSPTGAAQGTHYTVTSKSVTIPAGQATASFNIQGIYSQYTNGRKDTLVITLKEPGIAVAPYDNTMRLVLRGPCFEPDIVLAELKGAYGNTNEVWGTAPDGPYTTTVTAVNQTSPTTGTITVANVFNNGWTPLVFTLDWTDPLNRKVTLVTQSAGGNAGDSFGATYNGIPYGVRPVPVASGGQVGTFSYCSQTIILKMQVGVFGVGYSGSLYTLTMNR
jgi:hypothetical protein